MQQAANETLSRFEQRKARHAKEQSRIAKDLCQQCGKPAAKKKNGALARRCEEHLEQWRGRRYRSRKAEIARERNGEESAGGFLDQITFKDYCDRIAAAITAKGELTVRAIHEHLGTAIRREWTLDALGVLEANGDIRPSFTLPTKWSPA